MITFPNHPVGWACKKCNKFDWYDSPSSLAFPKHVPHRGFDIGTCGGEMIALYDKEAMHLANGGHHD